MGIYFHRLLRSQPASRRFTPDLTYVGGGTHPDCLNIGKTKAFQGSPFLAGTVYLLLNIFIFMVMISKAFPLRLLILWMGGLPAFINAQSIQNPIVFVTQVPQPSDFTTIGSTFGNHLGTIGSAPRGGDLYIRYPDGALKNLTAAAGYGSDGFQGANAVAVRDPAVHWSGTKVLFSMVVGSAGNQYEYNSYYWQLYEISGLAISQTPVVTKVPNQPEDYNNVSPVYATDDTIIFTTDRPRNGERHLYPQLDEYEEAPTVSGLWKLNTLSGELTLLDHAPSGDFNPIIDSFGRVIFTRWDHMQRDQQADGDAGQLRYGTFNWTSEAADSTALFNQRTEIFPEPRYGSGNLNDHRFNFFFPWMINEDGSQLETVNHVGRHELHRYFNRSFNNDPALEEFINSTDFRPENFFQLREDPNLPGFFYAVDAPEFATHAAGQIIALAGQPGLNADDMGAVGITHPDTADFTDTPSSNHSGLYRNPLPTTDGVLIAAHTTETRADQNAGGNATPASLYEFRLKVLVKNGDYWTADTALTPGISKNIEYWDPDFQVTYNGPLWELQPVELVARERPPTTRHPALETPEARVFAETGVAVEEFQRFLKDNNLALIVMRNVTSRDDADQQQPYNLKVDGSATQKQVDEAEKQYLVKYLQLFQGDQIRGIGMMSENDAPRAGRRVLAQRMHEDQGLNPPQEGAATGSILIAEDGSVAAVVPAQRAMTWQLADPDGEGVVRERYWLSFQPGEIRTCASCHGLNKNDQLGAGIPRNEPLALKQFLESWSVDYNSGDARIEEIAMPNANSVQLRVVGKRSERVAVQASTDLLIWDTLGELTLSILDGSGLFVDDALVNGRKFYRLTTQSTGLE